MSIRVNPKLIETLEHYGAEDVVKCYHCGNCSAVCHHTSDPFVFPRRPMRNLQLGLEKKLRNAFEPWLCYYCGQCSEQCPRDAEPAETMMSLRRWLTAQYDFTGLARLFYTSWKAEIGAVLLLAVLVGIGLSAYGMTFGSISIYDGPGAFLPSSFVHVFDWTLAGLLTFFVAVNAIRMWWFTTGSVPDLKPSPWSYLRNLALLPIHFFSQKRYAKCDDRMPWFVHLVLVLSYVTMFVLIMFFLGAMQAGPEIRWRVHLFGYAASVGLLAAIVLALYGRLRKIRIHQQHSHVSDWLFLVLLLVVVLTGISQHVLHRLELLEAANVLYVAHLMAVVPMLLLEVPFGKWSHLVYRPLAMYLAGVHRDARRAPRQNPQPAPAPQSA